MTMTLSVLDIAVIAAVLMALLVAGFGLLFHLDSRQQTRQAAVDDFERAQDAIEQQLAEQLHFMIQQGYADWEAHIARTGGDEGGVLA